MSNPPADQHAEKAQEPRLSFGAFLMYATGLLRPYWKRCIVIAFSMLIQTAFFIAQPLSFRYILDHVIPQQDYELLFLVLGGLGVGFVLVTVLEFISGYIAAGSGAHILNLMAIDRNLPLIGIIKSGHQIQDRALSRPAPPYKRSRLSGLNRQIDVFQYQRIVGISEGTRNRSS